MPRFRHLLALVPTPSHRGFAERLTPRPAALLGLLGLLAFVTSAAGAQGRAAPDAPRHALHVASSRFDFVASGDAPAAPKPLGVHNGGTAPLTDVRLTRLAYEDSARGGGWLVSLPRRSSVAPDELATVGTLCVDARGLPAGTYRATAAVAAREISEPVGIAITLVVKDASTGSRTTAARCATAVTKDSKVP